jgi:hypothetical protein
MFYFRVERYFMITVISILCIASLALATLTIFSHKIEANLSAFGSIIVCIIPWPVTLISHRLYQLHLKSNALSPEELEKGNNQRRKLVSIMWFCAVFLLLVEALNRWTII